MNLSHSIRETAFNKFVVVEETGLEISSELPYDKAVDLVFKFENGLRWNAGQVLLGVEDLPALRAELAGTDSQDAQDEVAAHTWESCSTGCTPGGRKCNSYMKLWEKAHRLSSNWSRAPYASINRWGVKRGHLSMAAAMANVWMNGGEVITAPAGAAEKLAAEEAAAKIESDKRRTIRRAERIATGRPRRARSSW